MLPKAAPMSLDALLAFVDECDLSDDPMEEDSQRQPQWWPSPSEDPTRRPRRPSCESTASSSSSISSSIPTPKSRPRRDVVELSALHRKVSALTMQLARVKEARSENETTLLPQQSDWRIEAERQSKRRAAAQRENERLKAQLETQKQIAKRLVNVLKRSSNSNQIVQSLQRYEEAAAIRAQDKDDDFDAAFDQTDDVLEAADFASLPPVFFDAQMHKLGGQCGLSIEFRRRQSLPWNLSTAGETYWRFSPYRNLRKRFIVEQTDSVLEDMIGCTFRFQPKHDPTSKWFRGQYLQRRYKASERVVIVWRSLLESTERAASPTERLRMCGSGWIVIQKDDSTGSSSSSARLLSRFSLNTEIPSGIGAIQDAQHDARVSAMTDFVLLVSEGYADIAEQMIQLQ